MYNQHHIPTAPQKAVHFNTRTQVLSDLFNLLHDFHLQIKKASSLVDHIQAMALKYRITADDIDLLASNIPFDDYPLREMEPRHQAISDALGSVLSTLEAPE